MLAAVLGFAPPSETSAPQAEGELEVSEPAPKRRVRLPEPMRDYLTRSVPHQSARFLDHGVLSVGVAGGLPHLYRLSLGLGLFDHLTLGVTANWLPGASAPTVSPEVALAFWRFRWIEVGARYGQILHPPRPAVTDENEDEPRFPEQTHHLHATMTFSASWFSGGYDVGVARFREAPIEPEAEPTSFNTRWRLSGGLFLRFGTRRWGFTASAHLPVPTAELMFDLRFGLFEERNKGGWRRPEAPASDRATKVGKEPQRTIR